ncbi:hypothetical protein ES288_A13G172400v1 [Gossypium darwinii]|uniref:Uncharacterized protein n=2 Tax=Gossypium TaxID=3633 RepID=A0A5D2MLC9_GOSTO|nr:hypothetical protein ES288_A13G172400v1 [Gossypium darwinii]TYH92331.1 hypothetical protein ES332_A13G175200v1 [Gossypium tomentosum]
MHFRDNIQFECYQLIQKTLPPTSSFPLPLDSLASSVHLLSSAISSATPEGTIFNSFRITDRESPSISTSLKPS